MSANSVRRELLMIAVKTTNASSHEPTIRMSDMFVSPACIGSFLGIPSWQDRKRPRRKSEAVLDFRPVDNDDCAGCRHLIKVGHGLDLKVILLEDPRLRLHESVVPVSSDWWPIAETLRSSIANISGESLKTSRQILRAFVRRDDLRNAFFVAVRGVSGPLFPLLLL